MKRALSLRQRLENEDLKEFVAGLDTIPSLPTAYLELMKMLNTGASMHEIGVVISRDVAMSAKIMQMVNSAFFGMSVTVKDPVHAANLLGIEVLKALVIKVHVFRSFRNSGAMRFSIEQFTDHSLAVGALSKAIAEHENQSQDIVDDAFIAGMLHDIGKLIVVSNFPTYFDDSMAYAEEHGLTYVLGEQALYNTTHAEIGAYLLGLWGFRDNIVESVAFHHRPEDCESTSFSPLTAVHIADAMEHEYGTLGPNARAVIHMDYIDELDLFDKLGEWREVCLKTQHSLMQHDQ